MPAIDQLERLLYIIPAASRADGITLDELANALGVDARTIIADIEQATARAYYHPAATVDPFTIMLEDDRVQVVASSEFKRPVRLNARETLALGLGLRMLAAEADEPRRQAILAFAERLENELSAPEVELQPRLASARETQYLGADYPEDLLDYGAPTEPLEASAELEIELGEDDFRVLISAAIEDHKLARLTYLKAGESASEDRRIAPQQLLYANGRWYVGAYDLGRQAARLFRLDRTLDIEVLTEWFDPTTLPAPDRFTQRQQIYEADSEVEVTVRYAPQIARWIAEFAETELLADGSVRVRHRVADPRWLVRHVLHYGGDAVVEAPESYRQLVADAALRAG
jgi:proteasome accessory factor C